MLYTLRVQQAEQHRIVSQSSSLLLLLPTLYSGSLDSLPTAAAPAVPICLEAGLLLVTGDSLLSCPGPSMIAMTSSAAAAAAAPCPGKQAH
jgi:hypothetical protein